MLDSLAAEDRSFFDSIQDDDSFYAVPEDARKDEDQTAALKRFLEQEQLQQPQPFVFQPDHHLSSAAKRTRTSSEPPNLDGLQQPSPASLVSPLIISSQDKKSSGVAEPEVLRKLEMEKGRLRERFIIMRQSQRHVPETQDLLASNRVNHETKVPSIIYQNVAAFQLPQGRRTHEARK